MTIETLSEKRNAMPDVRGMGLKDALFVLESHGLRVAFTGEGSVRRQSIPPGAPVSPGATVSITLR